MTYGRLSHQGSLSNNLLKTGEVEARLCLQEWWEETVEK